MKRLFALFLALVMCLSLCACGKSEAVKAVETMIEEIGVVSFASFEKIKKAEDAYSALSDEEQKNVANYEVLMKARTDYDNLGIELNIDNYEKYLNVSFSPQVIGATDYGRVMDAGRDVGTYVYSGIEANVSVSGKSDNYDYNDVVVTVRYVGFYVPYSKDDFKKIMRDEISTEDFFLDNMIAIDLPLTVTTDIIGSGSSSSTINMPDGYWVMTSSVELAYEVIDVSGFLVK